MTIHAPQLRRRVAPSGRTSKAPVAQEAHIAGAFLAAVDEATWAFRSHRATIVRAVIAQDLDLYRTVEADVLQAFQGASWPLAEAIGVEYEASARQALQEVQGTVAKAAGALAPELEQSFTMLSVNARSWASVHAAQLVSQVGIGNLSNIQRVIVDGWMNHLPPRELARQILAMPGFGLHRPADNTMRRYYAGLIDSGMAREQALKLANARADRLKANRALMIARTEIIYAHNYGKLDAWRQAAGMGLLDRTRSMKVWRTGPHTPTLKGRNVCDVCLPMSGMAVPLDGRFATERGLLDCPPAHPHCRCTVTLEVDVEDWAPALTPEQRALAQVGAPPGPPVSSQREDPELRDRQQKWMNEALPAMQRAAGVNVAYPGLITNDLADDVHSSGRLHEATYKLMTRYPGLYARAVRGQRVMLFTLDSSELSEVHGYAEPGARRWTLSSKHARSDVINAGGGDTGLRRTVLDFLPSEANLVGRFDTPRYGWDAGWSPRGTSSLEGVINHEVGHLFFYELAESPKFMRALVDRVEETLGLWTNPAMDPLGRLDVAIEEWRGRGTQAIGRDLSVYAATNRHEFMAEALNEWWTSPAPRGVASSIGSLVDEWAQGKSAAQLQASLRGPTPV